MPLCSQYCAQKGKCGKCRLRAVQASGAVMGLLPHVDNDFSDGFGVAIDVGTTTVAAYLWDFSKREIVKTALETNAQARYGADVVSRLSYAVSGGGQELKDAINNQVNSIISGFGTTIDRVVITGNTVMLHLLDGMGVSSLAVSPYTPSSLFGYVKGNIYYPPCISAYVGADITSAVLACDMCKDNASLLIDIGTNGEIVLWKNGALTCTSTAAGPALEAAGISSGCTAQPGAINSVTEVNGQMVCGTIANASPIGICGTGLIDAAACIKRLGLADESGVMDSTCGIGSSGIFLTQEDLFALLTAKAAIRAGIDTLMDGTYWNELDRVYLAGSFGFYLNKMNAAEIGLLPREVLGKLVQTGNSAGMGACMLLQSDKIKKRAEKLARATKTVQLADSSVFKERFIANMTL